MDFVKIEGCGNDYLFFGEKIPGQAVPKLCDRRFGVGADGVVLVGGAGSERTMRIYNADGSEGEMCGNAIRGVALLAYRESGITALAVHTKSGVRRTKIIADDGAKVTVEVAMGKTKILQKRTPIGTYEPVLHTPVETTAGRARMTCLSVGNPHAVLFFDRVPVRDRDTVAASLADPALFPSGVNVGFSEKIGENTLRVFVVERGSGETLACGTGAVAAATAAVLDGLCDAERDIFVLMPGGTLTVRVAHDLRATLTGYAKEVFKGVIDDAFLA